MESGIISLQRLLTYASREDCAGNSLHGRSRAGRSYSKLINDVAETISDERGLYVWGRYEATGSWLNIYVGKTELRGTSHLRARIKEELSNERCVFWRPIFGEDELFTLGERYYPRMWFKYGKEWRRFLAKTGATHIVWVATPELANEAIPLVEAALIRLLSPTANIMRPTWPAISQSIIDEVVNHINLRVNEHQAAHSGLQHPLNKLTTHTDSETREQRDIPSREDMTTFTLIGTVPDYRGSEFLMPADNEDEFRAWLKDNLIDTFVDPVRGKPAVKIRGRFAAECHPGSRIRYTIEVYDRRDGRRIRGVKVESF